MITARTLRMLLRKIVQQNDPRKQVPEAPLPCFYHNNWEARIQIITTTKLLQRIEPEFVSYSLLGNLISILANCGTKSHFNGLRKRLMKISEHQQFVKFSQLKKTLGTSNAHAQSVRGMKIRQKFVLMKINMQIQSLNWPEIYRITQAKTVSSHSYFYNKNIFLFHHNARKAMFILHTGSNVLWWSQSVCCVFYESHRKRFGVPFDIKFSWLRNFFAIVSRLSFCKWVHSSQQFRSTKSLSVCIYDSYWT